MLWIDGPSSAEIQCFTNKAALEFDVFMCFLVHIQSCDMHRRTTKNSNGWQDYDCQLLWSCSGRHHILSWRGWTGIVNFPLQFCTISDIMIQILPYLISLNICMLSTSERFYSLVIHVLFWIRYTLVAEPNHFKVGSHFFTDIHKLLQQFVDFTLDMKKQVLSRYRCLRYLFYNSLYHIYTHILQKNVMLIMGYRWIAGWVEKLLISLFWEQSQVMMWTFLHIIDL